MLKTNQKKRPAQQQKRPTEQQNQHTFQSASPSSIIHKVPNTPRDVHLRHRFKKKKRPAQQQKRPTEQESTHLPIRLTLIEHTQNAQHFHWANGANGNLPQPDFAYVQWIVVPPHTDICFEFISFFVDVLKSHVSI